MTSRFKEVLNRVFSVTTAAFTGWLVKAAYDNGGLPLPSSLLIVSVIAQIVLSFVSSKDEKELENLRQKNEEMRKEREMWYGLQLSKLEQALEASRQSVKEIKAGNLKSAKEWREFYE
jgi:hypothetical protein